MKKMDACLRRHDGEASWLSAFVLSPRANRQPEPMGECTLACFPGWRQPRPKYTPLTPLSDRRGWVFNKLVSWSYLQ